MFNACLVLICGKQTNLHTGLSFFVSPCFSQYFQDLSWHCQNSVVYFCSSDPYFLFFLISMSILLLLLLPLLLCAVKARFKCSFILQSKL